MKQVKLRMRVTRQNDGWGCGYCACACVYRFYGLDPRRTNLRERLGTDNHALPWYAPCRGAAQALLDRLGLDTKGTLCPDVYAVLHADGFEARACPGMAALKRHLRSGHPALALVCGLAHWVVVAGIDDGGVLVLDSSGYADPECRGRLRYRLTQELFAEVTDGLVLVRKRRGARDMAAPDYVREYVRGLGFALRCMAKAASGWLGL